MENIAFAHLFIPLSLRGNWFLAGADLDCPAAREMRRGKRIIKRREGRAE